MPDSQDTGGRPPDKRVLIAVFCCIVAAVPFLLVKFPPITDLPQHAAQIRLFGETIGQNNSPYRIQWITPYSLVYAVLGANWVIFGPENAGRFGMLFIALSWIVMLHLLAARQKRPPLAAAFASVLFFGHIMYWGFYQFAFGWPVFIGYLLLLSVDFRNRRGEALAFFGAWTVLYFTHILWFSVAIVWLGVTHLILERKIKSFLFRGVTALPFFGLVIVWYPNLASYGFKSQTIWATVPFERILPTWLIDASFGGIKGLLEPAFFCLILVWVLCALLPGRRGTQAKSERDQLLLSAFFIFLALVLPDKHTNTIRFCQRWVPPALAFFLLALPEIRIRRTVLTSAVFASLIVFFAITSLNWIAFEKNELSGLQESLENLPPNPRVIGLSYLKESPIIRGRPFIQVFSYAQVYRGGELNFSFADFGPSLVIYREPRRLPWTSGLEWFPERARKRDLLFFEYAVVSGNEDLHEAVRQDPALTPVTSTGLWRLYKVSGTGSEAAADY